MGSRFLAPRSWNTFVKFFKEEEEKKVINFTKLKVLKNGFT